MAKQAPAVRPTTETLEQLLAQHKEATRDHDAAASELHRTKRELEEAISDQRSAGSNGLLTAVTAEADARARIGEIAPMVTALEAHLRDLLAAIKKTWDEYHGAAYPALAAEEAAAADELRKAGRAVGMAARRLNEVRFATGAYYYRPGNARVLDPDDPERNVADLSGEALASRAPGSVDLDGYERLRRAVESAQGR